MALHRAAGTVVDRLRIARYGYRFLDEPDNPQGGVNQGGWISEAYTEDGPIIAGFAREGCTMPAEQLPLRLGLQGPGRGGRVRPRRLADHLPGGLHPRERLPQRQRRRVPARRVTIHNAVATIRDDVAPTLQVDGPLLAGGWRRPTDELVVTASDASGISASRPTRAARFRRRAAYTRPAPCANVNARGCR